MTTLFFSAVIAGLVIGSIYGLVGIGYTVVFNATRVFNLAQGDSRDGRHHDLVLRRSVVLKLPQIVDFSPSSCFSSACAVRRTYRCPPLLEEVRHSWLRLVHRDPRVQRRVEAVVQVLFGTIRLSSHPEPIPAGRVPRRRRDHRLPAGVRDRDIRRSHRLPRPLLPPDLDGSGYALHCGGPRGGESHRYRSGLHEQDGFAMAGIVAGIAGYVIAPITFSDPTIGLDFTLKGFLALAIGGFGSLRGQ